MLTQLAEALVVEQGTPEYSQAISMDGMNAIAGTVTVDWLTSGAQLDVFLQESNDLENWDDLTVFAIQTRDPGHFSSSESDIAMSFVRLRFEVTLAEKVVLAAAINTAKF